MVVLEFFCLFVCLFVCSTSYFDCFGEQEFFCSRSRCSEINRQLIGTAFLLIVIARRLFFERFYPLVITCQISSWNIAYGHQDHLIKSKMILSRNLNFTGFSKSPTQDGRVSGQGGGKRIVRWKKTVRRTMVRSNMCNNIGNIAQHQHHSIGIFYFAFHYIRIQIFQIDFPLISYL